MLLTPRSLFLLLLSAVLLAGATFSPALLYVAGGYLFLLLVVLLADWRLTPSPRDFEVTRTNDTRLSLGAENLVSIHIDNRSRRTVRLIARDEYPPIFHADCIILDQSALLNDTSMPDSSVPGRHSERSEESLSGEIHLTPIINSGARQRFLAPLGMAKTLPRMTKGTRKSRNVRVTVPARTAVALRYHVRPPRRGDYQFGITNLRWWGVLGLVIRQARFPTAAPVKVYPNLLDIRKYELLVRRGQLAEMGLHQMRLLGSGTQFERLREYQADDEFRNIDWKATARRGKPIAREYETERSQNVIALLDIGRLMRSPVGNPTVEDSSERRKGELELTKLDYAVNAVLMLSYVAALRGDKIGLVAFADDVQHYLAPRAGRGQFYRMLALLYGVESEPVEASYTRAFAYLQARHKKRSLIVIFTDIAGGVAANEFVAQIAPLAPRHLPLLVAIGDPSVVQLARQSPHDSATVYQRMVAEQLLDERALTMEALRRRGALTLDVPANQLTISVVNEYLELKARGRI